MGNERPDDHTIYIQLKILTDVDSCVVSSIGMALDQNQQPCFLGG